MKRILLIWVIVCIVYPAIFAQQSIYVSAMGNDDNDGLSEARPIKSFSLAVEQAFRINGRVVVTGTISLGTIPGIFWINNSLNSTHEITITGKQNASGTERAVLSARGSGGAVLSIRNNSRVRFEHIEISGGEGGQDGVGLTISGGSRVTLGQGAVVCGNSSVGITIHESSTCIIDGGEVRDNNYGGIVVARGNGNELILQNGTIQNNRSSANGGGVVILPGGKFTMSGGIITGNKADQPGGGVAVLTEGLFVQTGGTISNNSAPAGAGVVVAPDSRFNLSSGTISGNIATQAGGGVLVLSGGRFDQTGGIVSNNTAPQGADIYRQ